MVQTRKVTNKSGNSESDTVDGCEIHPTHHLRTPRMVVPLQLPTNNGFNHGFKVVQDFVHPPYLVHPETNRRLDPSLSCLSLLRCPAIELFGSFWSQRETNSVEGLVDGSGSKWASPKTGWFPFTPTPKPPLFSGYHVGPLLKKEVLPWKTPFSQKYPEKNRYFE